MPFFGKRASAPPTPAGDASAATQQAASQLASLPGAPKPGQKILPDEVWQGEIGKMLPTPSA